MKKDSIYTLIDLMKVELARLKVESLKPQNDRDNPQLRASIRAIKAAAGAIWDDHRNKSLATPGVKEAGL
jgi:hypothetical protein